jgi:hypothetical protein
MVVVRVHLGGSGGPQRQRLAVSRSRKREWAGDVLLKMPLPPSPASFSDLSLELILSFTRLKALADFNLFHGYFYSVLRIRIRDPGLGAF